jgi:YbbR domain-containing protein
MAWKPFRNPGLKSAALALGTLLWFTVSGHQIERRINVPVSFSGVPESFKVTNSEVDGVTVSVRGDDNRVSTIGQGDIRVLLNLEGAEEGANEIALRPDDVIAPLGVEVFQIEPSVVTVTLEKSARREVPVHPTLEGSPIGGLTIGTVEVKPALVLIEGPASRVASLASAITQRVVVSGHGGTFTQDVEVAVADGELHVVQPRTVRVTVHIVPAGNSRPVPSSSSAAPPTPEGR